MEAIEPAYGATTLLLIAAGAVALLLFLIIRVKLHAFVALVLVSLLTALAAGIPVADVPEALSYGFSNTLGSVALLVGFGVMIGRLLEITGGAQVLADTLIGRFGEKRAPLAIGVAALLFGFPIFFDAGLVVFLPIIITVARRFGGSLILYAFPTAGAFAAMHALVPPHPGPVAAAEVMGGNIGLALLVGVPVAVLSWFVGSFLVSQFIGRRVWVDVPTALFGEMNGGRDDDNGKGRDADNGGRGRDADNGGAAGAAGSGGGTATATRTAPAFGTVLGILLLPFVLISFNTVLDTLMAAGVLEEDATWARYLMLLGNTSVALLITVIVATLVLGLRNHSMADVSGIFDKALAPICVIILITGAGGMFGGVLRLSGIGDALSDSLSDLGMSLILQAFLISTILRVAQGSATVALTTTSGLIAASVADAGLSDFQISLLVIAIAAGATVLSHVNDSGFWLVSRFFEMDVKTTLKTWTVMETTLGLSAFVLALAMWMVA
ncbi:MULTISPECIES: GntP family permease [Mycobacteriaceae]|uniref:SLC13 family permease n=1 Tax=Mycolicibacterium parafortuitum TaxID=39692 RepID=A0ACC6MLK8_MYCPF|nr:MULTISPECIES: SLC13 family permease [Mycobacteriaceae]MDZ5087887.1 SLC13 family permease [Mycolicibacterium parafortuitum]GFM19100.1 gluconate transporter [Mycobacterium sp. PO1]GFM22470.1 gluconate transporter [Mycobacterium sp. PO2]